MSPDELAELESRYRRVCEGGTLERLSDGLLIVRRRKHEWTPDLDGLAGSKLKAATDPIRGSKFLRSWTLVRYVAWVKEQAETLGWTRASSPCEHTIELDFPVGYSRGREVTRVRIELSSCCIHGYPVQE